MIEYGIGKINLDLKILGQREDGYHFVETIILPVDLFDTLELEKLERGFTIYGEHYGEKDYCYLVHQVLEQHLNRPLPVAIHRKKEIPVGAGLAGGTADGTALARGLNRLYDLNLENSELAELLLPLGADFPYCVENRPSICTGIGDIVSPMDKIKSYPILLVNPGFSIAAKEAYSLVSSYSNPRNSEPIIQGLQTGNLREIAPLVENDLEKGIIKKYPIIQEIKDRLKKTNADLAIMTGSGPTVVGVYTYKETRDKAYEVLKESYPIVISTWTGGDR